MRTLDRLVGRVSQAFGIVAAAGVAAIMVAIVSDVTVRILTNRSINGIYELVESLVIVVAFMGLAYTERAGSSVRVTLLTERLSPGVSRVVRSIGVIAAALTAAWIAYSCWGNAFSSVGRGEVRQGLVAFPMWPARLLAALGMTLVAIEFVMTAIRIWLRTETDEPFASQPMAVAEPEATPGTTLVGSNG
ncbi:TRAP transporter small permease [Arthrobacter sp.]|uniref:TRAP transporter small permease subunit n=1 Tax=Arthrobacter sp. TaxID=1667 RepID=UPI0028A1CF7B|nr:TRAP transporter small permease [Arthrobacter sp.]